MKTCSKCKSEKPYAAFSKCKRRKDGHDPRCKECASAYYQANKEHIKARASQNQKDNRERVNKKNAEWRAKNPSYHMSRYEERKAEDPKWAANRGRAWKKANPAIVAADTANRRAKKLLATPEWRNPFFIREFYAMARLKSEMFGFEFQVDHVVPLRGKTVCGLHVEDNLQVIPAYENRAKHNKLLEAA